MKNKILGAVELQLLAWLIGWADILEGLIRVITLGFWYVSLCYPLVVHRTRRKYQIRGK